jgi:class 3 adenylate cyclase/tetratricopeptide (TPR) repeat protein
VSESVELATVLFVDLVGSTRLTTAVGPARADQLWDEYFALLREAISSSGGREVKSTGDGLMVVFPSASAGVGCAVLTQQLFERRYRRTEQQLHVRIGVGTGEAAVKDGDYYGIPTIEAVRLCDKAPPDGILVSASTRLMAGRVDDARFEAAGELELKGLPEPVQTFTVRWEPVEEESVASEGRWRLPSVLRAVPAVSYVGRLEERALIERSRETARGGARRLVLLSGEPGIGKTRLASYEALGAHGDGFAVCWGGCSEELAVPYEPWIEVCSQLVEHAPDELLHGYVERYGGELSRLTRGLAHRVPDLPAPQSSDQETERFLLFSSVVGFLRAIADAVPLCVVLDDLHWGDGQSVALLKHVARTVDHGSLQVIVTYRDSELGKDHPLIAVLADLRRIGGVERVALSGLGVDEVAAILAAAAGHELDRVGLQLAAEITAETGGNPFFVGEIVRNLSESGLVVFDQASGRWRVDRRSGVGLPESVREVVERRIEKLGDSAREVLTVAAVVGRSFDVELLAQLVDIGESPLLDQLEAAVTASVLMESTERVGRFSFAHALINHTLYQALGATRRARMHQQVALALEELYGEDPGERVAELARHWAAAMQPARAEKAIHYARRAGERALAALVPDEAERWFAEALELLDDQRRPEPGSRCELLIGLGQARRAAGRSFRKTLLEASRLAIEHDDLPRLTRAVLANNRGRTSFYGRVDERRVEMLEAAAQRTGSDQPALRARLLSLLSLELAHDPEYERRRALSDEALALARDGGDVRVLAQVLRDRLYTIWAPGTLGERQANAQELLVLANRLDDPEVSYWAHLNTMDVSVEAGDVKGAGHALDRCTSIAEHVGQPALRWWAALQASGLAVLTGSPEELKALAERALEVGTESAEPDAPLGYSTHVVHYKWCRGQWDELLAMLEEAVKLFPRISAFHGCLGAMLLEAGQVGPARAVLDEAVARDLARLPRDLLTTTALGYYAMLATGLDDHAAAAAVYEQLASTTEAVVWEGAAGLGVIDVYRGMLAGTLGRVEEADARLAAGIDLAVRMGATVWATRAQLTWAELLVRRGAPADVERAGELFGRARACAGALDAPGLIGRAEAGGARVA